MIRTRIVVSYVACQAIILPILLGAWDYEFAYVLLIQIFYAALLVAVALGKRAALWILFVGLVAQAICIESSFLTFFVNIGSGLRVGIILAPDLMDGGVGFNLYGGYYLNLALMHEPMNRILTDGTTITKAFMVNLVALPPIIGLWPLIQRGYKKNAENATEQPATRLQSKSK